VLHYLSTTHTLIRITSATLMLGSLAYVLYLALFRSDAFRAPKLDDETTRLLQVRGHRALLIS
jgi:hypothetical protein